MTRERVAALALAASGMLFASQAAAQAYLGVSLGQGDIDNDIAAGLITSGTVDGKDTAFKLFGGYQFTPNLALEVGYVDLGEATYSGSFFGAPVTNGKVEVNGFNISAVGMFAVNPQFSIFGKVGLFVWDAKASDITGGAPFSTSADGSDVSFGLGVSYQFTRNFSTRAEWERFEVDNSDANLLSIGLVYRF